MQISEAKTKIKPIDYPHYIASKYVELDKGTGEGVQSVIRAGSQTFY